MSIRLLFALVALAVLALIVIAAVRLSRNAGIREAAQSADIAYIRRWTSRWRWAGLVAGGVLALIALQLDSDGTYGTGRLAMAAPAIAGCVVLAATVLGEITARPRRSEIRAATLATRSLRDLLPFPRTWIATTGVALLAGVLIWASAVASPDDLGRAGRALSRTCLVDTPGYAGLVTASNGPWPGSFYSVPMALLLLVTLLLAYAGARVIRDRGNPDAAHAAADLSLRREALRRVVSAVGATSFGTLGPILIFIGSALGSNQCVNGGKWLGGMCVLAALASIVIAGVLLANLLLPQQRTTPTAPAASVRRPSGTEL